MKSKKKKTNKLEKWSKRNFYSYTFFFGFCTVILYAYSINKPIEVYLPMNTGDKSEEVIIPECDSNFLDDKWEKDEWWIQNGQEFTFVPEVTNKKGGPMMSYKEEKVSDNFHLTLDFESIANVNNKNNEINLVVYVGNLYEIILGDGNRENFYLKSNGKYVPDIKNNLNKNTLEHSIMFDEWTTIEINQDVSRNSKIRSIKVSFHYCPYVFGISGCVRSQPEEYYFEVEDSSNSEKVSRLISIGLRNSDSVIKTKFHCLKLENR